MIKLLRGEMPFGFLNRHFHSLGRPIVKIKTPRQIQSGTTSRSRSSAATCSL